MINKPRKNSYKKLFAVIPAYIAQLLFANISADAQIYITPWAQVHMQEWSSIYTPWVQVNTWTISWKWDIFVTDGDWITNVPVMTNTDSITVTMNGTSSQMIQSTNFYRLRINNPAWVELLWNQQVRDYLEFLNGLLHLEWWQIDLGGEWYLLAESETSRTTDIDGGWWSVRSLRQINTTTNADESNMRLSITTDQDLWQTEIVRGHDRKYSPSGMSIYLRYVVSPENPVADDIDVQIRYFDAEWDPANGPKDELDIWRQDGWWNRAFGMSNPVTNTIEATMPDFWSDTLTVGWTEFLPLPVTLLDIQASCTDQWYPALEWRTASEINNSHFVVQRSYDGQIWLDIWELPGAWNTSQVQTYSFYDHKETSGQRVYYRFHQIDFDWKSEYSPIVTAHCQMENVMAMRLFPNPTSAQVVVELTAPTNKDMPLEIYDMNGKIVYSQQISMVNGTRQEYIDVSSLWAGSYYIKVGEIVSKLIKQ